MPKQTGKRKRGRPRKNPEASSNTTAITPKAKKHKRNSTTPKTTASSAKSKSGRPKSSTTSAQKKKREKQSKPAANVESESSDEDMSMGSEYLRRNQQPDSSDIDSSDEEVEEEVEVQVVEQVKEEQVESSSRGQGNVPNEVVTTGEVKRSESDGEEGDNGTNQAASSSAAGRDRSVSRSNHGPFHSKRYANNMKRCVINHQQQKQNCKVLVSNFE